LFFADSGPKRTYQIRENAQKPLKQWHNAVWWLCVTLSLCATQSDAPVEGRARKIADSGAD
ncbi:TPA: hypothetical protein ACSUNC_004893, partial [Salmonella enterica subsp. diarizonae]